MKIVNALLPQQLLNQTLVFCNSKFCCITAAVSDVSDLTVAGRHETFRIHYSLLLPATATCVSTNYMFNS